MMPVRDSINQYTEIKVPDAYSDELTVFIENDSRILRYERLADKKIRATIVELARTNRLNSLNALSSFLIGFNILKEIEQDFIRIMKEDRILTIDTMNLLSKAKNHIDNDTKMYQNEIKDGEEQKRFHEGQTMNLREVENMSNNILIALYDNDEWVISMHKVKEYERERGKMMREFDKKIECSKTNLGILANLEKILDDKIFEGIKTRLDHIEKRLSEKSSYIRTINDKGNLLKDENLFADHCLDQVESIIKDFFDYTEISYRLKFLNTDLKYNIESLNLNLKRWLIEIPLAGERAASEPLNKILDYMVRKQASANEIFEDLKNREDAEHLTECMKVINANMNALAKDYNSIEKEGTISITGGGKGVRNTLRIKKSNTTRRIVNLNVLNYKENVEMARIVEMEWKKRKEEIQHELRKYDEYLKLLTEVELKIQLLENEKTSVPQNHKENLERTYAGYRKLKGLSETRNQKFRAKSIPALFGMIIKSINLRLKRMSCLSPKDYTEFELDANLMYQIIFKLLKKKKRLKYNTCANICANICCCGCGSGRFSKFQTLHNCNNIEPSDMNEVIVNTRVLGCLKNSSGQRQEFLYNLRGEDVLDSHFQCCKGVAEILVLAEMHENSLNLKFVKNRLKHSENDLVEVLENHKYKKLKDRIKGLRVY